MDKFYNNKAKNSAAPEIYRPEELDCIESHIAEHFGGFDSVFHEIVSPDIHVDLCLIPPDEERDFYTIVTMGMGAHRMNIPAELQGYGSDRAELLITLPPDWQLPSDEEAWYWPLRWLKILARLPGEEDTWLGWGHTVPNAGPFSEQTELCCMLLLNPYVGDEGFLCTLPNGERVQFYQLFPLYEEEMLFKIDNGAEALLERLVAVDDHVVDLRRLNVCPRQ